MLVSKFHENADPFIASGYRLGDEVDVQNYQPLRPPLRSVVYESAPLSPADLSRAAALGERLSAFKGPWQSHNWRLLRCLAIYQAGRCDDDILNRIHQFTRCIEGLIAPSKRGTTSQFKHRTELFVGPRHHDLMGELYEVRSHIEHMHEYRYLEPFDRAVRLHLAELEAVAEWIARECLSRILLSPELTACFGGLPALEAFWALPQEERRRVWGPPVDPRATVAGFRFDHVRDQHLGKPS
jgi:hypothetical protein